MFLQHSDTRTRSFSHQVNQRSSSVNYRGYRMGSPTNRRSQQDLVDRYRGSSRNVHIPKPMTKSTSESEKAAPKRPGAVASDSQQARSNCTSTVSVDRHDDFDRGSKSMNRARASSSMARGCNRVEGPERDEIPHDIYAVRYTVLSRSNFIYGRRRSVRLRKEAGKEDTRRRREKSELDPVTGGWAKIST
jgi:hypothetical protein